MKKGLIVISIIVSAIVVGIFVIPNEKSDKDIVSSEVFCTIAGGSVSEYSFGKYIGPKKCCEGLIIIEELWEKNGDCGKLPDAGIICSDCGNSICEEWENLCNCPADCQ